VLNTVDLVELTEEEQGMQMLEDTKEFELQFSDARPALDAMTRWILHLYYTKGLKDREIGELVKVSGNWICCQRRDALKKLHALGIENAEDVIRGCGIH
jgi:DNA-directed RNA polymerase specialized sigma subunit